MMLYLKTIWYLYKVVLEQPKFKNQPLILKPFWMTFALWCCVLVAIPIRTVVAKFPFELTNAAEDMLR